MPSPLLPNIACVIVLKHRSDAVTSLDSFVVPEAGETETGSLPLRNPQSSERHTEAMTCSARSRVPPKNGAPTSANHETSAG